MLNAAVHFPSGTPMHYSFISRQSSNVFWICKTLWQEFGFLRFCLEINVLSWQFRLGWCALSEVPKGLGAGKCLQRALSRERLFPTLLSIII